LALLFCQKRKRKKSRVEAEVDLVAGPMRFEARPPSFDPQSALYGSHLLSSSQPVQSSRYATTSGSSFPSNPTDPSISLREPLLSHHPAQSSLSPPNTAFRASQPPTNNNHSFVVANPEAGAPAKVPEPHITPSSKQTQARPTGSSSTPSFITATLPPPVAGSSELTEEQANFVNNLRGHNVPTAEIARLMEIMRRERQEALGGGAGSANDMSELDAPPRYDFRAPE
jgi:hypothetical protein